MINLMGRANRRCGSQHKQTTKMKTTMSTLTAALLLLTGLSGRAQADNAEQEQAIARIEKLGGAVELDEQRPGKPVIKVDLRRTKVTDADLEILKAFTQLRSLILLSLLGVTDAGMKYLKGLTALEHLDLGHTEVGDAGLENLKDLTKLKTLTLDGTPVTDAGIKYLKGLTDLRSLNLCLCTTVTDAGVGHLAGLTKIQVLDLNSVQVTDAGLKHLHGFTALERMNVGDTKVTEAGVQGLLRILPNAKISR
jgi:Leucine-rich repeat (LRR) protein